MMRGTVGWATLRDRTSNAGAALRRAWRAEVHPRHPVWGPVIATLAAVWRILRWAWGAVIIGGIIITVVVSLIVLGTAGFPSPRRWALTRLVLAHPGLTLLLVALLSILAALAHAADRTLRAAPPLDNLAAEYVLDRVERLDAHDYVPRYVPGVYLPRREAGTDADADALARATLLHAAHQFNPASQQILGICVFGRPTAGKTRFAWEALRATLHDWIFVRWPNAPEYPFDFARERGRKIVVWLDDLHEYANPSEAPLLNDLPRRFAAVGARLIVVATCRDGADEQRVHTSLGRLLERLQSICLADISRAEADDLAEDLQEAGVEAHLDQFDQTPGSLLLGVQGMRDQRYPALPESARGVLHAMKLLRSAGIFNYPTARVSATAADLFGVAEGQWLGARDALVKEGFVRLEPGSAPDDPDLEPVADVYLERAVPDYPASGAALAQDWPRMEASFTRQHDADGLVSLGIAFASQPDETQPHLRHAATCFRAALDAYRRDRAPEADLANANARLGDVALRLALLCTGDERITWLETALDASKAAGKVGGID
jgi:hypothetical protein